MRVVKSFSLEKAVAEAVENIKQNERSRKVNQVLKEAFLKSGKTNNTDLQEVKQLLQKAIQSGSVDIEKEGESAGEALNQIINMRG